MNVLLYGLLRGKKKNDAKTIFRSALILSVSESDLLQSVVSHKPALVHVAVDTVQMTFTGVLPHLKVAPVIEHRFSAGVLSNHQPIGIQFAGEVAVVKIGAGIDKRLLLVDLFHQSKKFEERVAKLLRRQSAFRLDVYHGNQVLIARTALSHEIAKLYFLFHFWPIKMVRAHFQPVFVSQINILFISAVYIIAAFSGLEIDVCHF